MHAQIATVFASFIITLSTTSEMLPLKTSAFYPLAEIINIIQNNVSPVFHISITKFQQFENLNVG